MPWGQCPKRRGRGGSMDSASKNSLQRRLGNVGEVLTKTHPLKDYTCRLSTGANLRINDIRYSGSSCPYDGHERKGLRSICRIRKLTHDSFHNTFCLSWGTDIRGGRNGQLPMFPFRRPLRHRLGSDYIKCTAWWWYYAKRVVTWGPNPQKCEKVQNRASTQNFQINQSIEQASDRYDPTFVPIEG